MKIDFNYLLNSITHISCDKNLYSYIIKDNLILKKVKSHILLSRATEFRFPLFKNRLTYREYNNQIQLVKRWLTLFRERDCYQDWFLKISNKEKYFNINGYCFSEKREPFKLFDAIELILDDNFFHYAIENS